MLQSMGSQRIRHEWATEQQEHTIKKNNNFMMELNTRVLKIYRFPDPLPRPTEPDSLWNVDGLPWWLRW